MMCKDFFVTFFIMKQVVKTFKNFAFDGPQWIDSLVCIAS